MKDYFITKNGKLTNGAMTIIFSAGVVVALLNNVDCVPLF